MALPQASSSSFDEVVTQILRPTTISSFKGTYGPIKILLFTDTTGEPTEELELEDMFPFHTISDLATRIYIEKELQDVYHPQNLCILRELRNNKYIHFRYVLHAEDLELHSPITAMQERPDSRFVDLEGNVKDLSIQSRGDMLLEHTLFNSANQDVYTLHVYTYRAVLAAYTGLRPINRVDWEGKIRVFFPEYPKENEDGSIAEAVGVYTLDRVMRFKERLTVIQQLEQCLQDKPLRKPGETTRGDAVNLANVRNLRFAWVPLKHVGILYEAFRLESIFYDFPVSTTVPYIRFYPKMNTPISKIHVEGPLNIPSLEKPDILLQWTQERSLRPDEDVLMAKLLLRPGSGSVHPLYATLYIFYDGSAKLIIQPPSDVKGLSVQADLYNLSAVIESVLATIPKRLHKKSGAPAMNFTPSRMLLDDAYIVLNLWLERDDTFAITKKSLLKVLPFFRPFFQVTTSPIKDQNPILSLRYKCVNNFRTPSKDFQFLQSVIEMQKLAGKTSINDLVKYYRDEFDVAIEVAQKRVADYLANLSEFSVIDPVTMAFTQTENPGIDIAIFGKDGYYTFHIYRVDSIDTLRRIKTLLALLVSVEPADFEDVIQSAKALEQDDTVEEAAVEAEAEAAVVVAVASLGGEGEGEGPSALLQAKSLADAADMDGNEEGGFELDQLGDFAGFGEEDQEEAPSVPLETLVASSGPAGPAAPSSGPAGPAAPSSGPAAPSSGPVAVAADDDDDEDAMIDPAVLKIQPSSTYFRKRLQLYDRKLFVYRSTHKSQKKYPSACAGNALKQPAVMSEDEYSRMKELYEKEEEEGKVQWVEYPIKKGALAIGPVKKTEKNIVTERITVLRYGSNLLPGQANIYTCSLYWCRQDEIVILKADFEGTVDRKGRPKDKNTCPFCRGGLVKNRKVYVKGESVIERAVKDKGEDGKSHLFIQFLTKNPHPDGLYLPCCFLKEKLITEKEHPAYASLSAMAQQLVATEPTRKPESESVLQPMAANYSLRLSELRTSYITGAEKLPLEITPEHGPQIGIVPPAVDAFFAQQSVPTLVKLDHTVWKLMTDNITGAPNVSGFFRIAVENRKRFETESLFAAVAPYFGYTGIVELRRKLYDIITPRVFLGLNYGNFLFDFYDPADPPPTSIELFNFASRLGIIMGNSIHKESLSRAYKAYKAFTEFLEDTTQLKEFRQFYGVFTLPDLLPFTDAAGAIRTKGILFIVVEVTKEGAQVRCPPYGVTPSMLECDVAFIIHYVEDRIWEPLFYTRNSPSEGIFENTMVFTRDTYADWPEIVKTRVAEFQKQCKANGLGMYTDSPSVDPTTMLRLSQAIDIASDTHYILRDSYNHVSAVIYLQDDQYIYLPVIDDGVVYPFAKVELDWKNFIKKLAPANVVEDFYSGYVMPLLTPKAVNTYEIVSLIRLDRTLPDKDIYAFHLKGGLVVPVKKPVAGQGREEILESEEGQELPWMIDTKLAFGETTPTASLEVDYKEFEEIYQHLRFTFSNWLAGVGSSLKTEINSLLYANGRVNMSIPIYEKRLRLFILLGNEILSWLDSSVPHKGRTASLKRIDCRVVRGKEGCSNRCVWKEEVNACLLHIPQRFNIGANEVDAKGLLVRKLIEELVRFPEKRHELMNKRVREYSKLREPVRTGNTYIIPENLPEWAEMLRMEWREKRVEKPRYIEEFTWYEQGMRVIASDPPSAPAPVPSPSEVDAAQEEEETGVVQEEEETGVVQEEEEEEEEKEEEVSLTLIPTAMPDVLKSYLTTNANFFTFFEEPTRNIHPFLEYMGIDIQALEDAGDTVEYDVLINQKAVDHVAKTLSMSVYQLVYEEDNPVPPTPLIAKLYLTKNSTGKTPYIFIVKLPDGRVGLLSESSERFQPIPFESLPRNIQKYTDGIRPIIKM